MASLKVICALLLLGVMGTAAQAQKLEQSFYLTDSLLADELRPQDRALLDSLLTEYHAATEDEGRLDALEQLLENADNDAILWHYSQILIEQAGDEQHYLGVGYNFAGLYHGHTYNTAEARRYYRLALSCFEKENDLRGIGYTTNNLGANFYRQGEPDSALHYYHRGLATNEELGDSMGIAVLRFNLAGIYEDEARLIEAIDYYQAALTAFEALQNKAAVAYALNNISALFEKLEDYQKAIDYQGQSLAAFKEIGHPPGVAYAYNNLGCLYREIGRPDTALVLLNQSLALRDSIGDISEMISTLNNIAMIQERQGDRDLAQQSLERALSLISDNTDRDEVANTYKNLGGLFIGAGLWDQARNYLDQALEISQKINHVEVTRDAAQYRMEVAERDGDWETAYTMQHLYYQLRDSLLNDETANAVRLREMSYNFEKEALADSLANEVEKKLLNAEHERSLERATIYTWAGALGAILMLILAVVLYRNNRRRKVHNEQLAEKNAENELLLGEIHHRVKNNLQVISSLLSLQEKNLTDHQAKKAILEGKERVKSMGLIHKMLYQNDSFSGIEMNHYVNTLVKELLDTFGRTDVQLKANFDSIRLDVETAVPLGLIINELVINALKYAYTKTDRPQLDIRIEKEAGQLILAVSDNGHGEVNEVESSASFGMKLIRSLTRQLRGSLDISRKDGLRYTIAIKDFKVIS